MLVVWAADSPALQGGLSVHEPRETRVSAFAGRSARKTPRQLTYTALMETENVAGKKERVKGGGVCIYCGWDGGRDGLHDEHAVPYSLGGNTELLGASCIDCEAVTSYLDGYMANAIFGHLRVHMNLQSRSGHDPMLPALIELPERPLFSLLR